MNSLIDDLLDGLYSVTIHDNLPCYRKPTAKFPFHNIYSENDKLYLEFALAGYKKEDLGVELENGNLIVKGTVGKEETIEGKDIDIILNGIKKSDFSVIYSIPDKYDYDSVEVGFEDGLLKISFNTAEEKKPKKLEIK